jgi:type IV pilus biogenesis protein CpaD/CtpE
MKTRSVLAAAVVLLMASCQFKSTQTQSAIPGTYVNYAKGEFGEANDTLVIVQVDGNSYLITRKTTYRAIRNGKLLSKHRKVKKLNGTWDVQKQELDETTTGRIFRFDVAKRLLLINQAKYSKIN